MLNSSFYKLRIVRLTYYANKRFDVSIFNYLQFLKWNDLKDFLYFLKLYH